MNVLMSGMQIPCWFVTSKVVHRLDIAWPVSLSAIRAAGSQYGTGVMYYKQHGTWISLHTSGVNGSSAMQLPKERVPKVVQLLHLLES